jgi:hypothetical protein
MVEIRIFPSWLATSLQDEICSEMSFQLDITGWRVEYFEACGDPVN